jgi:hypothetical protein
MLEGIASRYLESEFEYSLYVWQKRWQYWLAILELKRMVKHSQLELEGSIDF